MIGVVTAAYNASEWIIGALTSLVQSDTPDWRVVVVDDGSTDRTSELVERMLLRPHWEPSARSKIFLMRREHSGLAASVNAGMKFLLQSFSDIEYVTLLAADDWVSVNYLRRLASELTTHVSAACAYGRIQEFGLRTAEWRPQAYEPGVLADKMIIPGCSMWRRSIWETIGGFDERFDKGLEDWHFAARAEALGFLGPLTAPVRVEDATYWHRAHDATLTSQMTDEYRQWGSDQIARLFTHYRLKHVASPHPAHAAGPLPRGPYPEVVE